MTTLYHLNDVLAKNDTTVERLRLQYALACKKLGIVDYILELHAAPFGESEITAVLLKKLITDIATAPHTPNRSTICVNNASRAKHNNSGNAKGSQCLRGSLLLHGKEIHVVGVDDTVFAGIADLFHTVVVVHDITLNGVTKHDISQGSQFRSLEYFPLVQVLVETGNSHCLRTEPVSLASHPANGLNTTSYDRPVLSHTRRPGSADLRTIQLVGQAKKFRNDRGYAPDRSLLETVSRNNEGYEAAKKRLQSTQVLILDRDHFGNTKCLSAHPDGVIGLTKALTKHLGDTVVLTNETTKKPIHLHGHITTTISDKTGLPCLRNGSSRGPEGEVLVELNYSIDATGTVRNEIIDLPLGTVLTLS